MIYERPRDKWEGMIVGPRETDGGEIKLVRQKRKKYKG